MTTARDAWYSSKGMWITSGYEAYLRSGHCIFDISSANQIASHVLLSKQTVSI